VAVAVLDTLVAQFRRSKPLLTRDRIAELSAADWSCDIARAREELGFVPRVGLEDGMRQTAEWYRMQGWL
jgi:nucleoside-diphosphate-sugar epimerase